MAKIFAIKDGCIFYSQSKIFILQQSFSELKVLDNFNEQTAQNGGDAITKEQTVEVIHCIVSSNQNFLACILSSKKAIVWELMSLKQLKVFTVPRYPVASCFSRDCNELMVADKTGDVFQFSINDCKRNDSTLEPVEGSYVPDKEAELEPKMGHLSMLLDTLLTSDGKYIITCDRDEKIRVTCYPNMYNIRSYCLGHTEFVSRIVQLDETHIISGAGDGTIKLWHYTSGTCIDTYNVIQFYAEKQLPDDGTNEKYLHKENHVTDNLNENIFYVVTNVAVCCSKNCHYVAVSFYGLRGIHLFIIKNNKIEMVQALSLSSPSDGLCFLSDECLVASCRSRLPFVVWVRNCNSDRFIVSDTHPIMEFGRKHGVHFYDNPLPSLDLNMLYKQKYDNITEYMSRKEKRIAGNKNNTIHEEVKSNKKIKVSIKS